MTSPRKVLYVQHAQGLGGSCASLRAMLEAIDRSRFHPVVALIRPTPEVTRYHSEAGLETIPWPDIATFEHTTGEWWSLGQPLGWPRALRAAAGFRRGERRTLELVRQVKPDLVHLNSAVLYPSARALHRARVPFLWHVREIPAPGHLGLRQRLFRKAMTHWPSEVLFLSEVERRAWVGAGRGRVVPEFVDMSRFNALIDGAPVRDELGIPADARVILYMGGSWALKGILPLLEAMALVRAREPKAICLMPGAPASPPATFAYRLGAAVLPLIGSSTFTQRVESTIARLGIGAALVRIGFSDRMERLVAASDLVVFPSLADHFARPAVEAAAMEKPVVASRFPMIEEQVRDKETGLLVPPGDVPALAAALLELLGDPGRSRAMGTAGRAFVRERFDLHRNTQAVMQIYEEILAGRPARR